MNLAIFDIDGTLLHSTAADDAAYAASMKTVLGIDVIDTDWSHYRYSTDSGLTREIAGKALGRGPTDAEVDAVREEFCRRLQCSHEASPGCLVAVEGAAEFLVHLASQPDWRVAIATGSWCVTARLKLDCAMLNIDSFPMATADVAIERVDIVRHAMAEATKKYATAFARTLSIGDGVWDYRAANALGIAFLGIGSGLKAERLRKAGAERIVRDFSDCAGVMEVMKRLVHT